MRGHFFVLGIECFEGNGSICSIFVGDAMRGQLSQNVLYAWTVQWIAIEHPESEDVQPTWDTGLFL